MTSSPAGVGTVPEGLRDLYAELDEALTAWGEVEVTPLRHYIAYRQLGRTLSTDHSAGPVLDLLDAFGWAIVDTTEANVHATIPDGCVYVGWLPTRRSTTGTRLMPLSISQSSPDRTRGGQRADSTQR
ncbi:hypothetical protein ACWFRT_05015 [Streptomyces anulatus]